MNLLGYLQALAGKIFHGSRISQEMDEEVAAHIELRADDLERGGMSRAEAERRARIEFGGQEKFKEASYEALGGSFFETVVRDVRFSARILRKSPGFSIAAALTLALGIGANAVVFSVMNRFLLHPLDVPQADTLFQLERANEDSSYQSYPNYIDLRDRNRSFDGVAAYNAGLAGFDDGGVAVRTWYDEVSGNYFDVLRVRPMLGRFFHAEDEHGPNSAPYIVLTQAFWHTRFQDDPGVVGRVVQLNKHPYTIIGVAPTGFHGTLMFFWPDYFIPIVNHGQMDNSGEMNLRGKRWVFASFGHLKPGVTQAQALGDLNAMGADLEKKYPEIEGQLKFRLARPSLYGDYLGKPIKAFLTGLMLLAGLILLAACANLGSLFAARAADRSRDVALRLALGAGRSRILRQLFTEAILISLVGGAIGVLGGMVLLRSLSTWVPFPRAPLHVPVTPDPNVYVVALLMTLASGFLFGAVPVRQVLRTNPYEVVKAGASRSVGRRISLRDVLLVGQIAICAVLVTSSMVALRGLVRSLHSNFGIDPQNVIVADTDLAMGGYSDDKIPAMQKRMADALAALPGVESVAVADRLPLCVDPKGEYVFKDDVTDLKLAKATATAVKFNVSPDYFQAVGTSLLMGRPFTQHDDGNSPRVAVVNRVFAERLFGSVERAMGGFFRNREGKRIQVVGVAEDGKYETLTEGPNPALFVPILQAPSSETWLVVRSKRDPQELSPDVRRALRNLDAAIPFGVGPWEKEFDITFFGPRIATQTLGVMGLVGAMLSITGIFGMAAYSVSRRLRELGIRVALGGQRKEVLSAAIGRAVKLLAIGSATGLMLGILASPVLAHIVYQATSRDPIVLGGVVLAMALLGVIATWIPARRALAVNPLILLREE